MPEKKRQPQINFDVPIILKRKFNKFCTDNGYKQNFVLTRLVEYCLANGVPENDTIES